jgi:iron-sulfur cluster repair protein YtfE (RIC family)
MGDVDSAALDPLAILLAEHREAEVHLAALREVVPALEGTDPAGARTALDVVADVLAFLDRALEPHIRKEEEALFPPLRAKLGRNNHLIDEMVGEHEQVRLRCDKVRAVLLAVSPRLRAPTDGASPSPHGVPVASLGKPVRMLLRTLRVHFQNEERVVFPLAGQRLSGTELSAAACQMLAIAAEIHGAPSPKQTIGPARQAS